MTEPSSLLITSGSDQIDQIVLGVIGVFALHFPDRLRGWYYQGSCADQAVTPLSDVDVAAVFKDRITDGEQHDFTALAAACKRISPRSLDLSCIDEATALHADQLRFSPNWGPVLSAITLKCASVLAYGEDIRGAVPLVPHDVYRRTMMHFPYLVLVGQRGHPARLPYPLAYPDPTDEFYGYTARRLRAADGTLTPSTKRLVHTSGFIGAALIALHTSRYIADKRTAVRVYQTDIHDAWAEHVRDVQEYCRVQWAYGVPQNPADRRRLHGLCEQELAFENYFLAIYQEYLVQELAATDEAARRFAQERLRQIA